MAKDQYDINNFNNFRDDGEESFKTTENNEDTKMDWAGIVSSAIVGSILIIIIVVSLIP